MASAVSAFWNPRMVLILSLMVPFSLSMFWLFCLLSVSFARRMW